MIITTTMVPGEPRSHQLDHRGSSIDHLGLTRLRPYLVRGRVLGTFRKIRQLYPTTLINHHHQLSTSARPQPRFDQAEARFHSLDGDTQLFTDVLAVEPLSQQPN